MSRIPFIAGNWKMHKTVGEAVELVKDLAGAVDGVEGVDIGVAPPFTALGEVARVIEGTNIKLMAQDLFHEDEGAYTGEISGKMLKDIGVEYVIVGHSERRYIMGESNELVNHKLRAALRHNLKPILCIGETIGQRKRGLAFVIIDEQLRDAFAQVSKDDALQITIAYEPVWAIGTGETASPEQAQEVHAHIRERLETKFGEAASKMRIQYGGSVKPDNAAELISQPDVDGALVGGAALKADSFAGIIKASKP